MDSDSHRFVYTKFGHFVQRHLLYNHFPHLKFELFPNHQFHWTTTAFFAVINYDTFAAFRASFRLIVEFNLKQQKFSFWLLRTAYQCPIPIYPGSIDERYEFRSRINYFLFDETFASVAIVHDLISFSPSLPWFWLENQIFVPRKKMRKSNVYKRILTVAPL